jgi:hypothetical protein
MDILRNYTDRELRQMRTDRRLTIDTRNAVVREIVRRSDQARIRAARK